MKTLLVVVVVVVVAAAATTIPCTEGRRRENGKQTRWGYGDSNGPDTWPDTFPMCDGSRQSPVSLVTGEAELSFPSRPFNFDNYDAESTTVLLINTGHAAEVKMKVNASVSDGSLPGTYTFHQFHFHWGAADTRGSEHTVDHVRYAGELHLVHYKQSYGSWEEAVQHDDGVAVLSVLLKLSSTDNPHLQPIVNVLMEVIMPHEVTLIGPFVLKKLLPDNLDEFFSYQGSLTTPGCNEVVTWTVFRHTIPISSDQLQQFRMLMAEDGSVMQDNFRNLQPLNDRKVYRSWGAVTMQ